MDTLYTLFRSVDNSHSTPLTPAEAAEALARKKAYFVDEAKANPLAREILRGGTVICDGYSAGGHGSFLAGPPTFFRTHELLRKTRSKNLPVRLGEHEYPHNEVVAMFARCIPNVRLCHNPWCSLGNYTMSLGLAWGGSVLAALIVARSWDSEVLLDHAVLYHMGLYLTIAALLYTTFKQNRDLRRTAPWNAAMYVDLNADMIRRDLPLAAAARKEAVPRQGLLKVEKFYYDLARKIERHGFDDELSSVIQSGPSARPAMSGGLQTRTT